MPTARCYTTALLLSATLLLPAQSAPSAGAIRDGIRSLRQLPEAQRGPRTGELARQITALPAGMDKLKLADSLAHLATEGDPGRDNLQSVADTLSTALAETPAPAAADGKPSDPYRTLAALARYENMKVMGAATETDQFKSASATLAQQDEEASKLDFSLKDMHGKTWTKAELAGKVVLLNFWATWCPPCRQELPNLDAIAAHYAAQGLVILAVTDEDAGKVDAMFRGATPHFTILLDKGRKVEDAFHVTGIPRTLAFDRQGKLVAVAADARTQHQFLLMLRKAGLTL